jgi:hypothetical protein
MDGITAISQVSQWYLARCDGDWEHQSRVEIGTLDNPGWQVRVNVSGTNLDGRKFDRVKIERSDADWVQAWVEQNEWRAACGPLNLDEALSLFVSWAAGSGS